MTPTPDLYSIIAGRIVSDPNFVIKLMEMPEQAIRDALAAVEVYPTDEEINALLALLEDFKDVVGFEYILRNSRDYLADRPEKDMI